MAIPRCGCTLYNQPMNDLQPVGFQIDISSSISKITAPVADIGKHWLTLQELRRWGGDMSE